MRRIRGLLQFLLAAGFASAPHAAVAAHDPPYSVTGTLRTGADSRPATLSFACGRNGPNETGVLSVELRVPDPASLKSVFDFDSVEGPYPTASAPATLFVNGVSAAPLGINGSFVPDDAFSFETGAMMRNDARNLARVATLLRPLTEAPGTLLWLQSNPHRGGTPIEARFTLAEADALRLRPLLAPCLGLPSTAAAATQAAPSVSSWRTAGRGFATSATLRPLGENRFGVKIEGHAGECMLGVDGVATESPPGHMTLLAGTGAEQCRISLDRRGDTQLVVVDESGPCYGYHGARCNFLGTLTRVRH